MYISIYLYLQTPTPWNVPLHCCRQVFIYLFSHLYLIESIGVEGPSRRLKKKKDQASLQDCKQSIIGVKYEQLQPMLKFELKISLVSFIHPLTLSNDKFLFYTHFASKPVNFTPLHQLGIFLSKTPWSIDTDRVLLCRIRVFFFFFKYTYNMLLHTSFCSNLSTAP